MPSHKPSHNHLSFSLFNILCITSIPSHNPSLHTNHPFTQTIPSCKPFIILCIFTQTILSPKPSLHTNKKICNKWFVWRDGLCEGIVWFVWRHGLCGLYPALHTNQIICVKGWFVWGDGIVWKDIIWFVWSNGLSEGMVYVKPWFMQRDVLCDGMDCVWCKPFIILCITSLHTNHLSFSVLHCFIQTIPSPNDRWLCVKGWIVWREGLCHFTETRHNPSLHTNQPSTQTNPSLYYILSGLCK